MSALGEYLQYLKKINRPPQFESLFLFVTPRIFRLPNTPVEELAKFRMPLPV